MERITLTEAQKAQILAKLAEYHDETGSFDIDIDLDGELTVNAKGLVEVEVETEYDYYGLVYDISEKSRYAEVELTGWRYDPATDDEVEVEVDEDTLHKANEYLNAA